MAARRVSFQPSGMGPGEPHWHHERRADDHRSDPRATVRVKRNTCWKAEAAFLPRINTGKRALRQQTVNWAAGSKLRRM